MFQKPAIKAARIISDIRAGMTDSELMEKYKLSAKGLHSVFRKLVAVKAMKPSELYGRHPVYEDTVDLDQDRRELREYLQLQLPVCEAHHTGVMGRVSDLSFSGLRINGIRVKAAETRSLVIHPEDFFSIDAIVFKAVCRWVRREGPNRDYCAGFELVAISEDNRRRLEELMAKLRLANQCGSPATS